MLSDSEIKCESGMDYVSGVANVGLYASHHSSPSDYDHMAEMAVPPPQEVPLSPFCHPLSNSAEDVSFATNTTSLLLPDDIDNGNNDENASQTNLVLFGNDDNTQLISSDYPEEQGFPLLTTSSRGVSGFDVSQHASATPQPDQQQLTLCSQQQQLQGYAYGTLSHVLTGRPATSSTSAFQHYHRQQQQQQQPNCFNAFFRRQQSTTLSGPPATVSVSSRNLTFLRTPSLEHATTTMASNDTVLHTRRLSLESTKHLSQRATAIMEGWYSANTDSPYPSKREKEIIAKAGGITVEQVNSWFANRRNRSHNTRPKKNMKHLHNAIVNLCNEYQEISCGILNATDMCSRILNLLLQLLANVRLIQHQSYPIQHNIPQLQYPSQQPRSLIPHPPPVPHYPP